MFTPESIYVYFSLLLWLMLYAWIQNNYNSIVGIEVIFRWDVLWMPTSSLLLRYSPLDPNSNPMRLSESPSGIGTGPHGEKLTQNWTYFSELLLPPGSWLPHLVSSQYFQVDLKHILSTFSSFPSKRVGLSYLGGYYWKQEFCASLLIFYMSYISWSPILLISCFLIN